MPITEPQSQSPLEFERLFDTASGGDATARFELGLYYYKQNEFGRARRWFSRAGKQGHGQALVQLGLIELQGLGIAANADAAQRHFHSAAAAGEARGHYELAMLLYRGREVQRDHAAAAKHLNLAARGGCGAALCTYAILAANHGDQEQAARCFEMAAERGDMFSQSAIAQRLENGLGVERDPLAARRWASRALAAGSYCQRHYHQLADPDSLAPDPVEDLKADQAAIDLPEIPFPIFAELASKTPVAGKSIRVFDDIYSHEECEYLIEMAAPFLLPSHTVHPETGIRVHNELRTSHGWSFHPTQEDIVLLQVKERLAKQTGMGVNHAESFAMLRYRPGQEYRAHYDFIDPASGEAGQEIGRNGQRKITIFSYLQTVAAGGETEFPRLDLRVSPRQGRAVIFQNTKDNGDLDLESLHASLPVIEGEKWLATLWFRDRPVYD